MCPSVRLIALAHAGRGFARGVWLAGLLGLFACSDDRLPLNPLPVDAGGAASGAGGGGGGGATTTAGGAGGGAAGPRCSGLLDDCGVSQIGDCCARWPLRGGTFLRSYDGVTHTDSSHPATVSSFSLDVYEVTVGRFRAFVAAGMGTRESPPLEGAGAHPLIADSGWFSGWELYLATDTPAFEAALACDPGTHTWTHAPNPSRETLPINCVTWFEAFAFCAWDGGRLPTEAEWNYAAAGGDEQRPYPWGDGIDSGHGAYGCLGDGDPECGSTDILAVGFRPGGDGKWGHADLGGNVWELVLDWFDDYADPCLDCANVVPTAYHVGRGGSWGSVAAGLLASERNFITAAERSSEVGFRCAVSD